MWKKYFKRKNEGSMIGKYGMVTEDIKGKCGVIQIRNRKWIAESEVEIPAGKEVIVQKYGKIGFYVVEVK